MLLSSPTSEIEASYDVVVVGSGYGAAIAASRLSRARQRVCVLERGREIPIGHFPERPEHALHELQIQTSHAPGALAADLTGGHAGSQLGLYDVRLNDNVNVLVGCGLGGTSLINAGVAGKPDERVFDDPRWPRALRNEPRCGLDRGFELAGQMLQPREYPDVPLAKLEAHRRSAEAMGDAYRFCKMPINVAFEDGPNAVGVHQPACCLCGNCVAGCNTGAKNALTMNYLPDARAHGARIFTQVEVRFVERAPDGQWNVHFVAVDPTQTRDAGAPTQFVRAGVVVLGAGTLGSTEILLRSRSRGLPLSGQLGHHFNGNGDVLAFAYDPTEPCNGIGVPTRWGPPTRRVGPTITSAIHSRGADLKKHVMVEEGAIPSALAAFATSSFAVVGGLTALVRGTARLKRTPEEAANASQTYLVMSLDDTRGTIDLDDNDRPRVDWPPGGGGPAPAAPEAAAGIGGTYIPDPLAQSFFGSKLTTVHPLGGCAMGDDGTKGVVNHLCQVFEGDGDAVHSGLYVCDGSVLPMPLGVNPLFTISAIAERAVAVLARAREWAVDYTLPHAAFASPVAADPPQGKLLGIEFDEELRGFFSKGATGYDEGFEAGKAAGTSLVLTVTIATSDVDTMMENPAHAARLWGTVTAPSLSREPLTITDGIFNLFYTDPDRPGQLFMRYRMLLTGVRGETFRVDGFKQIGDDAPTNAYLDSRTLYVTLYEGSTGGAPVLGRGIVQIDAPGIVKLLQTFRITHTEHWWQHITAASRFFGFFVESEVKTYLADILTWVRPHTVPSAPPAPPPG